MKPYFFVIIGMLIMITPILISRDNVEPAEPKEDLIVVEEQIVLQQIISENTNGTINMDIVKISKTDNLIDIYKTKVNIGLKEDVSVIDGKKEEWDWTEEDIKREITKCEWIENQTECKLINVVDKKYTGKLKKAINGIELTHIYYVYAEGKIKLWTELKSNDKDIFYPIIQYSLSDYGNEVRFNEKDNQIYIGATNNFTVFDYSDLINSNWTLINLDKENLILEFRLNKNIKKNELLTADPVAGSVTTTFNPYGNFNYVWTAVNVTNIDSDGTNFSANLATDSNGWNFDLNNTGDVVYFCQEASNTPTDPKSMTRFKNIMLNITQATTNAILTLDISDGIHPGNWSEIKNVTEYFNTTGQNNITLDPNEEGIKDVWYERIDALNGEDRVFCARVRVSNTTGIVGGEGSSGISYYNYSGISAPSSTHIAFDSASAQTKPPTTIKLITEVEASIHEYHNISAPNIGNWSTITTSTYPSQRFVFKIAENVGGITEFCINYRGYGTSAVFNNVSLYIWNSSAYELVGNHSAIPVFSFSNIRRCYTSNIANYINTTGNLSFVAQGPYYGVPSVTVTTDFIEVNVTYTTSEEGSPVIGGQQGNGTVKGGKDYYMIHSTVEVNPLEQLYTDSEDHAYDIIGKISSENGDSYTTKINVIVGDSSTTQSVFELDNTITRPFGYHNIFFQNTNITGTETRIDFYWNSNRGTLFDADITDANTYLNLDWSSIYERGVERPNIKGIWDTNYLTYYREGRDNYSAGYIDIYAKWNSENLIADLGESWSFYTSANFTSGSIDITTINLFANNIILTLDNVHLIGFADTFVNNVGAIAYVRDCRIDNWETFEGVDRNIYSFNYYQRGIYFDINDKNSDYLSGVNCSVYDKNSNLISYLITNATGLTNVTYVSIRSENSSGGGSYTEPDYTTRLQPLNITCSKTGYAEWSLYNYNLSMDSIESKRIEISLALATITNATCKPPANADWVISDNCIFVSENYNITPYNFIVLNIGYANLTGGTNITTNGSIILNDRATVMDDDSYLGG